MTAAPSTDPPYYGPSRRSFDSPTQEYLPFDVGGEQFAALKHPPGEAMFGILRVINTTSGEMKASALADFLDLVLTDESAVRFAARLRDKEHPITAETAGQVVMWLAQDEYQAIVLGGTARPTGPSSPGQPSQRPGGGGSTAGAPPEASTPVASPSGVS